MKKVIVSLNISRAKVVATPNIRLVRVAATVMQPGNNVVATIIQPGNTVVIERNIGGTGGTGTTEIRVIGETPAGAVNGINATFTSLSAFNPATVEVFVSGLRMHLGSDYTTTGATTLLMADSPQTNENVTLNYIKI